MMILFGIEGKCSFWTCKMGNSKIRTAMGGGKYICPQAY